MLLSALCALAQVRLAMMTADIPCKLIRVLNDDRLLCKTSPESGASRTITVKLWAVRPAPRQPVKTLIDSLAKLGPFDVIPRGKQGSGAEVVGDVNVQSDPSDPNRIMRSLGYLLVRRGMARVDFPPAGSSWKSTPSDQDLIDAEQEAKSQRLGIWRSDPHREASPTVFKSPQIAWLGGRGFEWNVDAKDLSIPSETPNPYGPRYLEFRLRVHDVWLKGQFNFWSTRRMQDLQIGTKGEIFKASEKPLLLHEARYTSCVLHDPKSQYNLYVQLLQVPPRLRPDARKLLRSIRWQPRDAKT